MNAQRLSYFIAALTLAAGPAAAQDPFTYETPARLFSTADLNADGRLDAVITDRAGGATTLGFQDAAGAYTWSDAMATGAAPVTCLVVGRSGPADVVGVTTPAVGRLVFLSAPSSTAEPVFTEIFPKLPSSDSMAFFPINSTSAPELLVTGDLGSGVGNRYGYELRPPLSGATTPLWERGFSTPTKKITAVRVKTGAPPRVAEYFGSTFYIEGVSLTGLTSGPNSLGGALTSQSTLYAHGNFDGTAYTQFLFLDRGTTTVRTAKITEPAAGTYGWSALSTFTLPQPADLLVTLPKAGGGLGLGIIFTDGTAALYHYSGSGAPTLNRSLTPAGSAPADVLLPSGNDAVLIARGGQWQRFLTGAGAPLNPQWNGALTLPGVSSQVSNIVFLTAEAFAKPNATVTGTAQAREWTTAASGGGTSWNVTSLVSSGASGLGSPSLTIRNGPANTTSTLLNQLRTNVSIHFDNAAPGKAVGDVAIAPPGGTYPPGDQPPGAGAPVAWIVGSDPASLPPSLKYDQPPAGGELIKIPPWLTVSLNPTRTGDAVRYRINDGPWTQLSSPGQIELFAPAVIESYATSGVQRSPIRRQSYFFTPPPALAPVPGLDSDSDGLSDQWEKTFAAVNPGDDSDGDGASNLSEYTAGTDPSNSASTPPPSGPLVLTAAPATGSGGVPVLRLEWTAGDSSVILEASGTLLGPWSPITTGITTAGLNNRYDAVTTPPAAPKNFFRLRRP